MLFSQQSTDSQHSTYPHPVSLRAAFVSSPRYHRNTCPADLVTAGHEGIVSCRRHVADMSTLTLDSATTPSQSLSAVGAGATGVTPVFDAPALAEETLLDVSLLHLLHALIMTHNYRTCLSRSFF